MPRIGGDPKAAEALNIKAVEMTAFKAAIKHGKKTCFTDYSIPVSASPVRAEVPYLQVRRTTPFFFQDRFIDFASGS